MHSRLTSPRAARRRRTSSCGDRPVEPLEPRRLLSVTLPDDVNPVAPTASDFHGFTELNGALLYVHNDGVSGAELFRSDGTAATTGMLLDINPAPGVGSRPNPLTVVHGVLYFGADDGRHGLEPWRSDGTAAGTRLVADLVPGGNGGAPFGFTAGPDGTVYFVTNVSGGRKVWQSDGTAAGTRLVHHLVEGTSGRRFVGVAGLAGRMYCFVTAGPGTEMWAADGDQFTLVTTIPARVGDGVIMVAGRHLVLAPSAQGGVWRTDGTAAGTAFLPGATANQLTAVAGSTVFFPGTDGVGRKSLWAWDGGGDGTAPPRVVADGLVPFDPVVLGDALYFGAANRLWATDGSAGGAREVPGFGVAAGDRFGVPRAPGAAGGRLYYYARDPATGAGGVYSSDGTADGTALLSSSPFPADFHGYTPRYFTGAGGRVYFAAAGPGTGGELWATDGTPGGTGLVEDGYPVTDPSSPSLLGTLGGRQYFLADDGVHGTEPWSTDGTPGGAALLKDVNPGPARAIFTTEGDPGRATSKYLFFRAWDGSWPRNQLWRTDGTAAGTVKLYQWATSGMDAWGVVDDTVYFTLGNAPGLWTSDGTAEALARCPAPRRSARSSRRWTACCTASAPTPGTARKSGGLTGRPRARTA
jgi:ELWxxDGT repeat protein